MNERMESERIDKSGCEDGMEEKTPVENIRAAKGVDWMRELPRLNAHFSVKMLAAELGVSLASVYTARKTYARKMGLAPPKVRKPRAARPADGQPGKSMHPLQTTVLDSEADDSNDCLTTLETPENELLTIAEADPETAQKTLARIAQRAIAAGIRNVPEPRTVRELEQWFSLLRRASGLDQKTAAPSAQIGLIQPIQSARRAKTGPELPSETEAPDEGSGADGE